MLLAVAGSLICVARCGCLLFIVCCVGCCCMVLLVATWVLFVGCCVLFAVSGFVLRALVVIRWCSLFDVCWLLFDGRRLRCVVC